MITDDMKAMEAGLAEKGIPIDALYSEAGIAQSTWWRWREGRYMPRMVTWQEVERAYAKLIDGAGA